MLRIYNAANSFDSDSLHLFKNLKLSEIRQSRVIISAGINNENFIRINIDMEIFNVNNSGLEFANFQRPVSMDVKFFMTNKIIRFRIK